MGTRRLVALWHSCVERAGSVGRRLTPRPRRLPLNSNQLSGQEKEEEEEKEEKKKKEEEEKEEEEKEEEEEVSKEGRSGADSRH